MSLICGRNREQKARKERIVQAIGGEVEELVLKKFWR